MSTGLWQIACASVIFQTLSHEALGVTRATIIVRTCVRPDADLSHHEPPAGSLNKDITMGSEKKKQNKTKRTLT